MSVSSEFQRYLVETLDRLAEASGADDAESSSAASGLRVELEEARRNVDTPLAECAERTLEALERYGLMSNSGENRPPPGNFPAAVLGAAENLIALSRIVLGPSPPPTDTKASA
jgi:hypothetical protein